LTGGADLGRVSSTEEGMIIGSIPMFFNISILLGEEDAKTIRVFIINIPFQISILHILSFNTEMYKHEKAI